MRNMVIGLQPEYVYPGRLTEWGRNNTRYAANLGASLITVSLLKQFDADYVDIFEPYNFSELRAKYDTCILAFATHLHPSRDISVYTDFVERLGIKTVFLSGGITDYSAALALDYRLHPSVCRLLDIASRSSEWIGVRGPHTASVLYRHGFRKVVPIGCPSIYYGLSESLVIDKKTTFEAPLVPYHLTLAQEIPSFLAGKSVLGQDYQDEVVFTENLSSDVELKAWLEKQFASADDYQRMVELVRNGGVFHNRFHDWFEFIGQHDFVIGPRLHGCIAGLIQGIPTVMTPRDLRVREICEFFQIPHVSYEGLETRSLTDIYEEADFTAFSRRYAMRYRNYLVFLRENGVESLHDADPPSAGYALAAEDLLSSFASASAALGELHTRLSNIESSQTLKWTKKLKRRAGRAGVAGRLTRFVKRQLS